MPPHIVLDHQKRMCHGYESCCCLAAEASLSMEGVINAPRYLLFCVPPSGCALPPATSKGTHFSLDPDPILPTPTPFSPPRTLPSPRTLSSPPEPFPPHPRPPGTLPSPLTPFLATPSPPSFLPPATCLLHLSCCKTSADVILIQCESAGAAKIAQWLVCVVAVLSGDSQWLC